MRVRHVQAVSLCHMHFVFLLPMCLNWDLRIKGLPGLLNHFPCVYPVRLFPFRGQGCAEGFNGRSIILAVFASCDKCSSLSRVFQPAPFYSLKRPTRGLMRVEKLNACKACAGGEFVPYAFCFSAANVFELGFKD